MATPSAPSPPRRSPRRWRFTWEVLAHTPTLRLFLFNTEVDPSRRCANLGVSLCLEESLLLITWAEEGAGDVALRVPMPRVLIDPVSTVQCVARGDHIEVKLALVLPLDHPMSVNLCAALDAGRGGLGQEGGFSDSTLPLSMDSDIKTLSARDVHLYCRACSTRLTRRPPRKFVEIPLADWRDVADNWFGACCCSFGGASEKLVHKYIKVYNCSESTCLLDGPSVIICKDDLDGYVFQKYPGEYAADNGNMSDPGAKSEGHHNAVAAEGSSNGVESLGCLTQKGWESTNYSSEHSFNERNVAIKTERSMSLNKISDARLDSSVNQVSPKELVRCCADETNHHLSYAYGEPCNLPKMQSSGEDLTSETNHHSSNIGSLGSGFLTKAPNLSNDVEWVEFLCKQCLSFIGSYPTIHGVNDPMDGGVRLFKCYISTSMDLCGHHNLFRKYTFQRVFASLLLESAADELSFRTIVRDLSTRSPMLQIILLNSKAWCMTGDCFENENLRCLSKVNMQPVVKVLFSDCSGEAGVSPSTIEQWITKNHADEVYMMVHQTKELTEFLKLAHDSLPPSYSSFEGMSLSYIER